MFEKIEFNHGQVIRRHKIPAELALDLISHFNTNNHPEDFLFNDIEQLECFAADVLASKLSAHFGSETIIEQGSSTVSNCFIRIAFFKFLHFVDCSDYFLVFSAQNTYIY